MEMSFSQNTSFLNAPCNWQDLYFPEECTESSLLQKPILNVHPMYEIIPLERLSVGREITKAADLYPRHSYLSSGEKPILVDINFLSNSKTPHKPDLVLMLGSSII
jgi:hypothetical protein